MSTQEAPIDRLPVSAAPACRPNCAACCTAPSISTTIPGMPDGKPAGVACVQLDSRNRCQLFGRPDRPAVCLSLQPSAEMCGTDRAQALLWLARLEAATTPGRPLASTNSQITIDQSISAKRPRQAGRR